VAERVLAACVERDTGLQFALRHPGEIGQRAVVIEVTVTHDERVRARRIDLQEAVVVEQSPLGSGEVEQDFAPLTAAHRFQVVREPVLEQQEPLGVERRTLHRDGVELAAPGEGVVDVVHDAGEHEAVHRRWRAHLRSGWAAAEELRPA
jgi:hypothetical protein